MQMFDVGLAAALKRRFTQNFHAYLKDKNYYIQGNNNATMRNIAVSAFIDAWENIANINNCRMAAAQVGLEPVDRSRPKSNQYARDLTDRENEVLENRRNRAETLNINNCIITDPEKIEEIRAYVQRSERDKYLCKKLSEFPDFKAIYRYLVENAAEHNVHMLTNPPPYRGVFFYDR